MILAVILGTAGCQGGAKIEHFGISEHQKSEICGPGEVLEKACKSNGILIRKCKLWRCKILDFHWFFNRIVLSAFFEKS